MTRRRIGIVGFDNVQALDLVGPADVFGSDALSEAPYVDGGVPPYEVCVIGVDGERFSASNGVGFTAHHVMPAPIAMDTLIIPGGFGLRAPGVAERVADWIQLVSPNVRRIASVCTGIYALAFRSRPQYVHVL